MNNDNNGKPYVKLEGLHGCDKDRSTDVIGEFCALEEILFPTKDAASQYRKRKSEEAIEAYKNSMTTIDDIVNFCLTNCVANAEEYTDWEARFAVIQKAKELGIKLDIE